MTNLAQALTMTNTSGLRPLGRAVLIEPIQSELKTDKIIIPENLRERSMMVEVTGRVVAIGPEAWKEEKYPRAQVGDIVMISKFCGAIMQGPQDNKLYRMVNAEDIFCEVTYHG